jgi:hypothetical protein
MSLVINTGVTARMPESQSTRSQHSHQLSQASEDSPEIKVDLSDELAEGAKEAAASTYHVTSLKALKQRFYKSSIG